MVQRLGDRLLCVEIYRECFSWCSGIGGLCGQALCDMNSFYPNLPNMYVKTTIYILHLRFHKLTPFSVVSLSKLVFTEFQFSCLWTTSGKYCVLTGNFNKFI
jgi:hypothetical protein